MTMFTHLFYWLFPRHCLHCGKSGSDFCDTCFSKIPKANPTEDAFVLPLFSYQHPPLRKVILALKFKGRYPLAKLFGGPLADAALSLLEDKMIFSKKEVIVVPIPASQTGRKKRGYNQSVLLAKALLESATFEATLNEKALKKIRETPRQAEIKNRTQRLKNISDAFFADSTIVQDKLILLVDDVTTTGATLREARRALRAAGASSVYAVTVAH